MAAVCAIPECQRPPYAGDGVVHIYCSRSHAQEALQRAKQASLLSRPSIRKQNICQVPDCDRQCYVDQGTGRAHDFCSRRHANLAASAGEAVEAPRKKDDRGSAVCKVEECDKLVYRDPVTKKASEYCSNQHYVLGIALLSGSCIRDGCSRTAWVDQNSGEALDYCGSRCASEVGMDSLVGQGRCSLPGCVGNNMIHPKALKEMGYCCEEHRLRATKRSLGPNLESFVDRTFRGGTTSATDFQLSVLTNRHPEYLSRKEQFLNKWIKPRDGDVTVLRMFKIKLPDDVRQRADNHMRLISNVQRRFHGTSCSDVCTFFVDLRGGPCGERTCNVCSICTHGFKLNDNVGETARRTNVNLRYGNGLYFSSVSGKANDYALNSEKVDRSGKTVRCMFMASVAVGRGFKTYHGRLEDSECPPPGHDSVIGEVGQDLNYDEVVVYKEEAALPTHLIVYTLH